MYNHFTKLTVFLFVWGPLYYSGIISSFRNYYSYSFSIFFDIFGIVLFLFVRRIILLLFFYNIVDYYYWMGLGYRVSLWMRGYRFMWSWWDYCLFWIGIVLLENMLILRLWIRNIDDGLSYLEILFELFPGVFDILYSN